MSKADLLVTAVAVLRDHALILPAFVAEVAAVLDRHYANYEILLVENGSTDGTGNTVRQLLVQHKCIRYLRLTRPTDDETAVMAGLDASIGDYVVTLHPDFDPPGEMFPMVEACRDGNDLVIGVERHPALAGPLYRASRGLFLALARRMARLDLVTGTTGFRAISRQAVNALVKVRMRRMYFPAITADVGLTTVTHPYDRISRSGSRPTRHLRRAVRMGLSVLIHNSITPLRVASGLGLVGSLLGFSYSLYVVGVYLFKPDVMPGWTTMSLAMSGLFALMFLMLALMGEYLGRLLEESTDRPLYHVRDELSSEVMLAALSRRNVLGQAEDPAPTHPADQPA